MTQSALLFTALRGPAGSTSIGAATRQGLLLTTYFSRPGATYFVDEANGDDDQARAGGPFSPFETLAAAVAVAVAGDTIFIIGTAHVSETLTISQSNLCIIGLNAPSQNSRARISQTGSTVFTPLVSVTGQGNRFENLATFHGFANASAQVCWSDSGGRNYYKNVQFLGMGHATAAAQAGGRSLVISGGNGENLFEDCSIGLDTILRATNANASLELTGASPRNLFRRCTFQANCSAAGDVHVLVGSGGIDRYLAFEACKFLNFTGGGGTSLTAAFSVHASAGGNVMLDPSCMSIGATKLSAAGPVYVGGAVPTGATTGLGVLAA